MKCEITKNLFGEAIFSMALSVPEQEITTVLHWFSQWGSFQQQDFMTDLVNKAVPPDVDSVFDAMNKINVKDKPPTMFQCQLKLFGQWFERWTEKERDNFMRHLQERNPSFVQEFHRNVETRLQNQNSI